MPHAAADGLNHALQIALAEPLVHRKRDEAATPCSGVRVAPCHERMGTGPKRRCLHPGPADYNPVGELFYSKQYSLISTSYAPLGEYPSRS